MLDLQPLASFVAVVNAGSFVGAADALGLSKAAVSRHVTELEARLGVRLLTRTTRSVATTEAGERLFLSIAPRFQGIEADLADLVAFREKPSGTVRLTLSDHALQTTVWPKLSRVLTNYPDIHVEL